VVVMRDEKKSDFQTNNRLFGNDGLLAMGMCQTNNWIPVPFCFPNPGTIPVSIPD
jgi:hypothetical protein